MHIRQAKDIEYSQGISAVTLDFYNTLVYHNAHSSRGATLMEYLSRNGLKCDPWEHQVLYDVFEKHGFDYSPAFDTDAKQRYLLWLTRRVFRRLNVEVPDEELADHVDNIWRILGPSSLGVFPEVCVVLSKLRTAGYPLAMISNWQCGLGNFCQELGIADRFDHTVSSAELGSAKPDRRIFDHACGLMGVPQHRVLHVGDSVVDDFEGARNAGLQAILLQRDADGTPSDQPTIGSLAHLPELLGIT